MKYALLFFSLFLTAALTAQTEFKSFPPADLSAQPDLENLRFNPLRANGLPAAQPSLLSSSASLLWRSNPIQLPLNTGVKVTTDTETGVIISLEGRPDDLPAAQPDKTDAYAYLAAVADHFSIENPYVELLLSEPITDHLGQVHVRVRQQFAGLPIPAADAWIHATSNAGFDRFTGHLLPTPQAVNLTPTYSQSWAENRIKEEEADHFVTLNEEQLKWISGPQMESGLILYFKVARPNNQQQNYQLAYLVESRPNLTEHSSTYLDAHTGEVLKHFSHLCGFTADGGSGHQHRTRKDPADASKYHPQGTTSQPLPPDGPYTTTVQNLYDQSVTINTFSINDTYLLVDGSRDMFVNNNGEIDGLLITYDGAGGSPELSSFDPAVATSSNNTNWTRTAASVHSNAGEAYQYFLDRHERNSIDGVGGNVYSFMNINEPDGQQMDNAFWNGRALFYGNGSQAFNRLPRGLDVAGHEMAHGVIQATADLVYEEQPGALNESFADLFGYLVEGESGDFRIGEDVVNTSVFTSGTMRDMQNPNNGAAGPQDFRWQPQHMDEYQNLPVNADNDNGGVHINSGIPNRAFYLFASHPAVGDARAEKVYYRALSMYLTRSSRFADLRIAVVMAADDEYGADVVAAANAAFDAVGIGGSGGDYTVDLEDNEGDRFLLSSVPSQSSLHLLDEVGNVITSPLVTVGVNSRPSLTDDGQFAVFVDDQGRIRVYNFGTSQMTFFEQNPQTIWRNAAVSKDGNRMALTTTQNDNRIIVYDFGLDQTQTYDLFNPTTAEGISTGDVVMSDAMEWDPRGELLMYDAQSRLDEGLTFWDIGFVRVWNNATNNFGDGNVLKLVSNLPDGVSIGNPTFSKNSPYIIAFEQVDFASNDYDIVGANIETGASNVIFENGVINYPNYGVADDRMVFDAQNTDGGTILGVIPIGDDKISAAGNAQILVNGGHWGVFFANGQRELDTSIDGPLVENEQLLIYPTLVKDQLTIEFRDGQFTDTPVQILDMSGRLVSRTTINGSGARQVDFSQLANGTYIVAVSLENGTVVERVIKR